MSRSKDYDVKGLGRWYQVKPQLQGCDRPPPRIVEIVGTEQFLTGRVLVQSAIDITAPYGLPMFGYIISIVVLN